LYELEPAREAQLLVNVMEMKLCGALGDFQLLSNHPGRQALGDHARDFEFARRECGGDFTPRDTAVAQPVHDLRCGAAFDPPAASMHLAHGAHEERRRHVLEHDTTYP